MGHSNENQKNKGRGGKRPGAGRPKGSQNTVTRDHKWHLAEMARSYAPIALETLMQIAESGQSESARVSAANALLDRGFGRPQQSMEMTGKDGKDLIPTAKGVLVVPEVMSVEDWEKAVKGDGV